MTILYNNAVTAAIARCNLLVVLVMLTWLSLAPVAAEAYFCWAPRDVREEVQDANAVFIGKVVSVEPMGVHEQELGTARSKVHFTISHAWKGVDVIEGRDIIADTEALYEYTFEPGKEYLVFAFHIYGPERLSMIGCPRVRPVELLDKEIRRLGPATVVFDAETEEEEGIIQLLEEENEAETEPETMEMKGQPATVDTENPVHPVLPAPEVDEARPVKPAMPNVPVTPKSPAVPAAPHQAGAKKEEVKALPDIPAQDVPPMEAPKEVDVIWEAQPLDPTDEPEELDVIWEDEPAASPDAVETLEEGSGDIPPMPDIPPPPPLPSPPPPPPAP